MQNNKQNKSKAPRPFTPEEIQLLKDHEKKMETDPEYRKEMEEFDKFLIDLGDDEES